MVVKNLIGVSTKVAKKIAASKEYREAYVRETIWQGIAHQIRVMRESRNMTQRELAAVTGKSQSNIARIEDPDYGKCTLKTLMEVADAFDVWLTVEFVPFSEGLKRSSDKSVEKLNAKSFEADNIDAAGWVDREPTPQVNIYQVSNDINTSLRVKVFASPSPTANDLVHSAFPQPATMRSNQ